MGLLKNIIKPEVRFRYKIAFKLSLIVSLSLLILAFKFFPHIEKSEIVLEGPQELFTVEDVQQTVHENLPPPPPPKPNILIATPSDDILEDVDISSTEIDFSEEVAPPPPPKKETVVVEEEPTFFVAVEEMPSPIGGIGAIQSKIKYPEIARRAGLEGTVYILAYLDEEGKVVKTEIAKEADKAVRDTKFTPGKQRGKPVKVKVMIPVKFQLKDAS